MTVSAEVRVETRGGAPRDSEGLRNARAEALPGLGMDVGDARGWSRVVDAESLGPHGETVDGSAPTLADQLGVTAGAVLVLEATAEGGVVHGDLMLFGEGGTRDVTAPGRPRAGRRARAARRGRSRG